MRSSRPRRLEAIACRIFERASYKFPADTLLRLRRGSDVLIKMPADRGTCANKGVPGPLRSDREERKCGKLATLSQSA